MNTITYHDTNSKERVPFGQKVAFGIGMLMVCKIGSGVSLSFRWFSFESGSLYFLLAYSIDRNDGKFKNRGLYNSGRYGRIGYFSDAEIWP
jgi:hypothetical protein